ncbi:MAG TPA: hypothetical protein VMF13_09185 [Luteitalea sp.]|nr:hypothetical protein [Luteitalea sp.]
MSTLPLLLPLSLVLSGLDADLLPVGAVMASVGPAIGAALRRPRGRPRKFDEPTRVVTLTLPESVIAGLTKIHADLGRAVVGLVSRRGQATRPAAELVVFGSRAVISVRPTPSLERRLGVELVPMPDGRALISFETPQSVADVELRLHDTLDDASLPADDRHVFETIRDILRDARRSKDVSLVRRNIIVLESATGLRRRPTRTQKD